MGGVEENLYPVRLTRLSETKVVDVVLFPDRQDSAVDGLDLQRASKATAGDVPGKGSQEPGPGRSGRGPPVVALVNHARYAIAFPPPTTDEQVLGLLANAERPISGPGALREGTLNVGRLEHGPDVQAGSAVVRGQGLVEGRDKDQSFGPRLIQTGPRVAGRGNLDARAAARFSFT